MSEICSWCNLPMDDPADAVWDHIIPRCRGGPDKSWNFQRLHKRCNGPAGKGKQLTPEAEALAAEHGIVLREPLPTSWPGSNEVASTGKPHKVNPYRAAREAGTPLALPPVKPKPKVPKVKVTVRKVFEVECHACHCIIDAPDSWDKALEAKRDHLATHASESAEPAA